MDNNVIYNYLREELLYNIKKQDQCTLAAYTIAVSVWTIALTVSNEWIAIIPAIILLPLTLLFCDCRYSNAFLATYMSIFLEDESGATWETIREYYYDHYKRTTLEKMLYTCSKLVFSMLSFVSCFLFWAMRSFEIKVLGRLWVGYLLIAFQIIIVFCQAFLCIKYSDISKIKKPIYHKWMTIYEKLR